MFTILFNSVLLKMAFDDVCRIATYADDITLLFCIRPTAIESEIQLALHRVEKTVPTFQKFALVINAVKLVLLLVFSALLEEQTMSLLDRTTPSGLC